MFGSQLGVSASGNDLIQWFSPAGKGEPMTGKRTKPRFGKHRGKVIDNLDPIGLGRILAHVPALGEAELNWALPCSPYVGPGVGFYAVPPIGANVWIEFEGGDLNYPICTGGFWTEGESPDLAQPLNPFTKLLKTDGISIALSDLPSAGGVSIECRPPAVATPLTLTLDSNGLTFTCGDTNAQFSPELVAIAAALITATGTIDGTTATFSGELTVTGAVTAAGGMAITGGATIDGAPVI